MNFQAIIKKRARLSIFLMLITFAFTDINCKKAIDVNTPTTSIDSKNVYTNNKTAAAVLTGIYAGISTNTPLSQDLVSIGLRTGLSSDELVLYSGSDDQSLRTYYQNNLSPSEMVSLWQILYNKLYVINAAIEGLNNSTGLDPSLKKQLQGEAKFMRAFVLFYLTNLYGDIPLVTSIDYTVNYVLSRSSQQQVFVQIISDLKESQNLLSSDYLDGTILSNTKERVRPTKWAAIALLARCYLYTHDWENAESQANFVINNTALYNLESLDRTFLMNNREAIWQLQPVNQGANTEDAKTYIIPPEGLGFLNPVYLSDHLLNSFELGDQRKSKWIDTITSGGTLYYFVYKYKSAVFNAPVTEYHTIFRLAEQYLIRAEARAQQNNINGALEDVNTIRKRAQLNPLNISNKDDLLTAIYHERQVELFTEWGHRWFDLKRTQTVNGIMSKVTPEKGGTWSPNWQFYPIPANDIKIDGNLIQNPGY
ncbi:RagB/SusD family nutrient uptake outer membrane protein [Chitinophaga sp. 212800010-3]|uniref:RagB/SusD family nutrient uptake outer membrane protein n=1 Tax=unclassified Chitinophaga TaxID=2619133 RepID=UPI002DEE798D|nr:RagB/SusD family nutrient uptake outer membrane protein [Chitinophaga sp. 212800010-3]